MKLASPMPPSGRRALAAVALVTSLLACRAEQPEPTAGAIQLALSPLAPAVVRVAATVSGPALPQIVRDLAQRADGSWSLELGGLAPGALHVELGAFDAAGRELFHGRGDATITVGGTAALRIFAQEVAPPPSYGNTPPRIDAVSVSALSAAPGTAVSVGVTATDPDVGASLRTLWRASAGTFENAAAPATRWLAPATAGPQTLFVTVTDEKGASAEASFTVSVVEPSTQLGALSLTVALNAWPNVTDITVSPSRVEPGQPATLTASAVDVDGDPLSFRWVSECQGTFTDPAAASTAFTPSGPASGPPCVVRLFVDDGRGGSAAAWSAVWVGPPPPVGAPLPPPPTPGGFVNGSFETGDYAGWTVLAFPAGPAPTLWGVGEAGAQIVPFVPVRDFLTGALVSPVSPFLPYQIEPTDGGLAAFQLLGGSGRYRMLQRITVQPSITGLPPSATFTVAASSTTPWTPGLQSIAVNIRDLGDQILFTQFVTLPGGVGVGQPPRPVEIPLAQFLGRTVVFEVEFIAQAGPVAAQVDAFAIR